MKKFFAALVTIFTFTCTHAQENLYWQQQVNYYIDVTLNDKDNALDGYIKMDYTNNSPDTLRFIWIHVWPNAYKNDKTAFSEQFLENGRTDFYFSDKEKSGYINRLDFKVNNITTFTEDHPLHQDIIKLMLPSPLLPKATCKIETPFHVQLPFNFSRGGYNGQSYQITQWYPKPAVYDRKGWHPIPYLDQGEFYSEFGNYKVQITVPENYVVAATGELQTDAEKKWLENKTKETITFPVVKPVKQGTKPTEPIAAFPPSSANTKTIVYTQNNIHDFAWFADKRFAVVHDTLLLSSGRIIDAYSFYITRASSHQYWSNSLPYIKQTILSRNKWIGEYPYNIVSVVEAEMGFSGGMEYPTITSISPVGSAKELEGTIEHEVGHNWFYGILGSNEREHAWMDEGVNTFYDQRYESLSDTAHKKKTNSRMPKNESQLLLDIINSNNKGQAIETSSEKFSEQNYYATVYYKTSVWLKQLEQALGSELFDKCMQTYFTQWKFKHPYPEDFKAIFEQTSGQNLDALFAKLNTQGSIQEQQKKKGIELKRYFSLRNDDNKNQLYIAPALGYNFYDKLMLGGLLHNCTLPQNKFQFLVAPMYATGSKQLNAIGRVSYRFYAKHKYEFSLAAATFSENDFTDSSGHTEYLRFGKIVPSVKITFANKNPRSTTTKFLQWKTFLINQKGLLFSRDTVNDKDVITYPWKRSYVNQLRFVIQNDRKLYPYDAELMVEQGEKFAKISFTGNYYLNYAKGGGMNVRFFAGKFFYLTDNTFLAQYQTDPYQLNMTGPKGYEDYTYSDYFIGRNEFEKFYNQQIRIRDGAFKVRTDLLSSKIGKTDNWLAAMNFTTDVPKNINPLQMLPFKIPLKAFFDLGTYADAWKKDAPTGRFLYDAGLQVSLFKNAVNIYFPILYSKVYRDYFKSTITEKRFVKNISFSIDLKYLSLQKLAPKIPL